MTNSQKENETDFRDKIATVGADGRRSWIYPSKPKGKLHNARAWVAGVLIAFLVFTPFVKVGGHPLFLLNVVERRFILFGEPFWPQDLSILVLVFITMILFIIVFSTIWGRLWCGWACPQTIFMEMVFRKIEFWLEGDGVAQKKLNAQPWTFEKLKIKLTKHIIFIAMAYGVAHVFLAWIIGVDELWQIINEPIVEHLSGFIALNFFTFLFYGVFSWFREQACVIVCPYGRFQSVLLDENTTVISYDFKRGEPRGKKRRKEEGVEVIAKGDCVDCGQCVRVCPTGIDIRHGTQLECVNCTACIDACDDIMEKLDRPKGLIRFASYQQILTGLKGHLTLRVKAYSLVLILLVSFSIVLLSSRPMTHITVTRVKGSVYQVLEDGSVLNLYRIKFANNTFSEHALNLRLNHKGASLRAPEDMVLPVYGIKESMINVLIDSDSWTESNMNLTLEVLNQKGEIIGEEELTFLTPRKRG